MVGLSTMMVVGGKHILATIRHNFDIKVLVAEKIPAVKYYLIIGRDVTCLNLK